MSEETNTQPGGGEAVPAAVDAPNTAPPKNDAEAEAREAEAKAGKDGGEQGDGKDKSAGDEGKDGKKKNRTREYIERINGENAELRRKVAEIEARLPKQEAPKAPNPDDFYNDPAAYSDALMRHRLAEERQRWEQEQQQQAELRKEQEITQSYAQRAAAFAEQNDDFIEAVGSIDPRLLSNELQAAIMAQENGPEIAYHLANNDDELWTLSTLRPDLVPLAVERLSSRLKAAPEAGDTPVPSTPAVVPEPKPISQTPPPAPRVGGRSPTEVPPEKMTDDEWYSRDRERRRRR